RQGFYCCYINLERSPDRRAKMVAELKRAGVVADRISAVDYREGFEGLGVSYHPTLRRWVGGPMAPAEIACCESHRRALRSFLASGEEVGVILEDDAILSSDFREAVQALIRRTSGWGLVRLEWRKRGVLLDPGVAVGGRSLVIPRNMTYGATALMFSRAAA